MEKKVITNVFQAEELPSLLNKAGEMERLKSTITKLDIFKRLAKSEDGKFELIKVWQVVSVTDDSMCKLFLITYQ